MIFIFNKDSRQLQIEHFIFIIGMLKFNEFWLNCMPKNLFIIKFFNYKIYLLSYFTTDFFRRNELLNQAQFTLFGYLKIKLGWLGQCGGSVEVHVARRSKEPARRGTRERPRRDADVDR